MRTGERARVLPLASRTHGCSDQATCLSLHKCLLQVRQLPHLPMHVYQKSSLTNCFNLTLHFLIYITKLLLLFFSPLKLFLALSVTNTRRSTVTYFKLLTFISCYVIFYVNVKCKSWRFCG